ncbi:MAG: outer membrane beta-barrel protein, partial [Bacteroidales bacterium]
MLNSILLVSLLSTAATDTSRFSQRNLSEVLVTDKLPLSTLHLDIRRVGVEVAQPAAMMSVNDLLSMTPSVDTDIEGNVYVRNSDKIQFTQNTVPLGFLNENRGDILLQIPTAMTGEIHVIQNPSLRYVPDGVAGIVDFRLQEKSTYSRIKKRTSQTFGLEAGSHGRVGGNYYLDTRIGDKFNFSFAFQSKQEYRTREFRNKTLFFATQDREEQNNDASAYPWTNALQMTAGYKVRPYFTMQLTADGMLSDYFRTGNIRNDKYKVGETEPSTMARVTRLNDQKFATGGLQYKLNYDLPRDFRQSLQFDASYRYYDKKERNHFDRRPKPEALVQDSSAISTYSNDFYTTLNHRFFEKVAFPGGYTATMTLNSGVNYRREDGVMISSKNYMKPVKPAVRDDFHLTRSIYALYSEASFRFYKLEVELGLRGEYTHLYQENVKPEVEKRKDHFDLYPRVAVSYSNRASQWRFDYSRRVNRPLMSELNPSVNNSDPSRIFV